MGEWEGKTPSINPRGEKIKRKKGKSKREWVKPEQTCKKSRNAKRNPKTQPNQVLIDSKYIAVWKRF